MKKATKYLVVCLGACLPGLVFASASSHLSTSQDAGIGNIILRSHDLPHKEVLEAQPDILKPVLPLSGANFFFKGQNATGWAPLQLATTFIGTGFGGETRGGFDRLLPPAQLLFLIEHAMDVPGFVRGFNTDVANELSARGMGAFFVHEGDMTEDQAQHFIKVVTKCMRTQESNEGGPLAYKTPEDETFCRGVSSAPGNQLKGVIGSALLEKYTRVQAGHILRKYLSVLTEGEKLSLLHDLKMHLGDAFDETKF